MTYAALFQDFVKDKNAFFSQERDIDTVRIKAKTKKYEFLAQNHSLIEQECLHLFEALKQKERNHQSFWLYAYYCTLMLTAYHQGYGKPDQVKAYEQLSADILYHLKNGRFRTQTNNERSFLNAVKAKLSRDLSSLADTPFHISKIHDWLGFTNIIRIQIVFSKFVVNTSLNAAREIHWLERLDKLFKHHIDLSAMNSVAGVFNGLSVGLFAVRFMLNAGLLLKHTVFPTAEEDTLTLVQRFKNELSERHVIFLNDMVWGVVNGLSNYAPYFNLSAPTANWLMAGFLLFDVAILLYSRQLAHRTYRIKQAQYNDEIQQFELQRPMLTEPGDIAKLSEQFDMVKQQLAEHEHAWQVKNATFWFNISAAVLLMSGFSASLLLTMPVAVSASFFVGSIAIAMYITGGEFSIYQDKKLKAQALAKKGADTTDADKECQNAKLQFYTALAKNTIVPSLLMATLAVSVPAALVLTLAYLLYEWGKDCIPTHETTSSPLQPA